MRILQIIQRPQLRGAEIFACQLSQELIRRGLHVDVAYLFSHTHFSLEFDLKFIWLKANPARRLLDIKAYKNLFSVVEEGEYDIVQANAADTLKYAALSKAIYGWKAKLIYRNANLMGRFLTTGLQRTYNRWLLSRCDKIISVSENCRQDLIKFFPGAQRISITIPIGTYTFDNIRAQDLTSFQDGPVFIHIGSFVREKNHDFLIDVFHRYFQLHKKGYLWLVGEGNLKAVMQEKIRHLGLEDRARFWGSRNDVISLLKSADILIMPSLIEGLPGVVLEALACGIPVIASNVGGIPEVIQHDVNGFCLRDFVESDYVKCMEVLSKSSVLYSKFATAGKQLINDTFHMKLIAERFFNFYIDALSGNGQSHR